MTTNGSRTLCASPARNALASTPDPLRCRSWLNEYPASELQPQE